MKIEENLPSFEIRVENGVFVIAAPCNVELLYGVYDLAERAGGYSFFEPGRDRFDGNRVKKSLPDGIFVPACPVKLKRRGFIQEFPFNDETQMLFDHMAKNKLNYLLVWMKYYDHLSEELKEYARIRGIVIESGHHNFDYWIPGKKYGKTHPHFFAMVDGKRITPSERDSDLLMSEQLCTTNEELRGEIVKNMVAYCDAHPEVKVISLVPNDGFGWCECPQCSKFYDKEKKGEYYNLSNHVYKADKIYHNLIDDISARLHKVRPDISLTFVAYVNYSGPAEGFKLNKNTAVHMAPYWHCINHAIGDDDCPINSSYAEDLKMWQKAKNGGEINIYEYYMGVNFYLSLPMVHFEEMFRDIAWYNAHGIDGILTQFHIPHWTVYGNNYFLMGRAARGENMAESIDTLFEMLYGKDAQMANIIDGAKIIDCKIGFVMDINNIFEVGAFKGCLIGVNKISVFLTDHLHCLIKCRGMENVIVVKQSNIVASCHINTSVGVLGNAKIFFQLFVYDARILFGISQNCLFYLCVIGGAAICQAKLPIGVGLRNNRIDHFS